VKDETRCRSEDGDMEDFGCSGCSMLSPDFSISLRLSRVCVLISQTMTEAI